MIRQICILKPEDEATVRSKELLAKLEFEDFNLILRERKLTWFDRPLVKSAYQKKKFLFLNQNICFGYCWVLKSTISMRFF